MCRLLVLHSRAVHTRDPGKLGTALAEHSELQLDRGRVILRSRAASLGAVLLAVATLSGCALTHELPPPGALICNWVSEEAEGSFELQIYGGLEYYNLPAGLSYVDPSEDEGALTGVGRWSYGSGLEFEDGGGYPSLTLSLDSGENLTTRIVGAGEQMKLEILGADPDGRDALVFVRSCE